MLDIFFILLFLILNGFFAASEIAVVTSRKSYVRNLSEKGSHSAHTLMKLQSQPDRLLATVQIGVTVMGSLASAIGGATSVRILKPLFASLPVGFMSRCSRPSL